MKTQDILLLALDVDGVLTDGSILLSPSGEEFKQFHTHDGAGLRCWMNAGRKVAWISGRSSKAVEVRARDLGIDQLHLGVRQKLEVLDRLLVQENLQRDQVAYMGDDLIDLPVMEAVGLSITVPNAPDDIRSRADLVTEKPGGHGAVREVVELLLRSQGLWDGILSEYTH